MSIECHDEVCITCSDQLLAVLVTGVDAQAGVARGTVDGSTVEVGIDLLDGVDVGEVLLCHGGVALQRGTPVEVDA
jgi:hydrogenase maturation factor